MAINPNAYDIDPFARAIPGQSLTEDPDSAPYLKPPAISSVKKALQGIMKGIHDPIRQESLTKIMKAGMSAETIASDIVMQAFTNGTVTPDMAELMKPPIAVALVGIAKDNGLERVRIGNQPLDVPVTDKDIMPVTEQMSSMDRDEQNAMAVNEKIFASGQPEDDMEMTEEPMMSEGFINRENDMSEEQV